MEDLQEPAVEPSSTETTTQDPLQEELERVQKREGGRTQKEKLLYTKQRIEQQLRELGVDDEPQHEDDEAPVTLGMLKRMQAETATKTALQLAEDIPGDAERELTKYHIQNTIRSTGIPSEDLKLARAIVNSTRNSQILEQVQMRPAPVTHSTGTSAPAKMEPHDIPLTHEELQFTKPPFNMTKEQILKTRR